MKSMRTFQMISLSLITTLFLVGCGDGGTIQSQEKLSGSLVKGSIDGATITIYDENGKEVASTTSKAGKFELPVLTPTSAFYTIQSTGGSYVDEATEQNVNVSSTNGLGTLLTKEELQDILDKKEFVAITPETTIFTGLVQEKLKDNNLSVSITEAEQLVYELIIKNSSPMPGISGDTLLKRGDLTKAIPSNQNEAFAKNRAISFSNLMKGLGLSPERVFEVLEKLKEDYKDGSADGIEVDNQELNTTQEYALARTRLFNDTTERFRDGNLSDAQQEELALMGFDLDSFGNSKEEEANLTIDINKYLASETLPTLHILPTMADEDGNSSDTQATYSFTANTEVNVTIETPKGSWVTPMWRYNNNPLPLVVRSNRGDNMTLNLDNQLSGDTTIHWHGFKIPAAMDGGPDVPVASNSTKAYTFTMNQPAAPLWFHPHPDMQTGKQVYMGLAGVYLLEDTISKQLEAEKKLPSGDKDIVLLVQDRRFDVEKNGVRELLYKNREMDSDGMLGDTILVNGSVVPKHEVSTTQYRYRLYNVSNARSYDFAFSDNRKFKVVATDGGLLNEPVEVDHIVLGAAERVEIVVDFSEDSLDSNVMLISKPFQRDIMGALMNNDSTMGGMDSSNNSGGSMMGDMDSMNGNGMAGMNGTSNMDSSSSSMTTMNSMSENGEGLVIMRFDITKDENDDISLYSTLPATAEIATRLDPATADNSNKSREFIMSMYQGEDNNMANMNGSMNMTFAINGKIFDENRVDEFISANSIEIWSIRNMSPMAHPFHAHAIQWQILDRDGIPAAGTDLGWKDTFLVQPGETVRIIGKFEEVNQGDYMYHCHILEHEDAGMMGYFRVGETGNVEVK